MPDRDKINQIARILTSSKGYKVPDDFDFHSSSHPQEIATWTMACLVWEQMLKLQTVFLVELTDEEPTSTWFAGVFPTLNSAMAELEKPENVEKFKCQKMAHIAEYAIGSTEPLNRISYMVEDGKISETYQD